ncbi:MAG: DNA polymerase III subunit beta [Desulfobulbus propionicus]|nr:MAG: DNA polymerase III subunit beta [Desulfobulbus propionicus]
MSLQFNISRDDLFKAISAQQNITNKKGTIAILSNVLIKANDNNVLFTGTDLEIGLKQKIPAEVIKKGDITLPAKKLFEITRESGNSIVNFKEKENNWIEITSGSSFYRLSGMESREFPTFPEYDETKLVSVNANYLADIIDKTIFSIANDKENIYSLTAGLLTKEIIEEKFYLKMVSSDGHRLTIMKKQMDKSINNLDLNKITLIPKRGIQEIRKFCEEKDTVQFGIEKKQVVLKNDDSLLIIRLVEGEFPDYQAIIKIIDMDNVININRIRFLESLKRINLFTEDIFHAIKMDISENKIVLTSQNSDFGSAKDEFELDYKGKPLSLGFNCRYFIDTLQVMEGDTIKACITSDESPCLITSEEDDGFLSIIMPMKL